MGDESSCCREGNMNNESCHGKVVTRVTKLRAAK